MTLSRRRFVQVAAGSLVLPVRLGVASAQGYPTRPVRVLVGYAAAIGPDIVARVIAEWLSDRLGQQFLVENRPGAASNIAAELAAKASPDGYTLLLDSATSAINASLYRHLNFNFVHDFVPVASIAKAPFVLLINPSVPAKTLSDFIAYAKANPGKLNMASNGNGTAPHVFGELFKTMAGVDLVHVPYRGSYMPDLLGGQVQVIFASITVSAPYVRSGKLRALGVTAATRLDALPNVPAIAEYLPGYEATGWYGLTAPRGTPAEIIESLNKEVKCWTCRPKR